MLMAMEAEVLMDDLLITRERKKASMDAPSTFDSRVASIAVREVKSTDVVIATVAASTEYSLSVIAFWNFKSANLMGHTNINRLPEKSSTPKLLTTAPLRMRELEGL